MISNRKAFFLFLVVFSVAFGGSARAESTPPQAGEGLPDFTLSAPENAEHRQYLGLADTDRFRISDLQAEVVLIEVFSMYCPHCQREAPTINQLYRQIEEAGLKDRIKLIGVGAGNSSFEVGIFQEKYDVPFPLIPDEDFTIHKRLGEVRTPYFLGVRLGAGGNGEVIYSQLGGIGEPDRFLDRIVELSSSKQGGS
jgi:peroxiredoxin